MNFQVVNDLSEQKIWEHSHDNPILLYLLFTCDVVDLAIKLKRSD